MCNAIELYSLQFLINQQLQKLSIDKDILTEFSLIKGGYIEVFDRNSAESTFNGQQLEVNFGANNYFDQLEISNPSFDMKLEKFGDTDFAKSHSIGIITIVFAV